MKMTKTIFHIQSMPRPLARPLAVAALLVILVLSLGGALAERMQEREALDRLTIGDVAGHG
jgi:hypothetical protein